MIVSAGLLMYRQKKNLEVFLCFPGSPYDKAQNWMIPKGKVEVGETHLEAAIREFKEETGFKIPKNATFLDLGDTKQSKNKIVSVWAFYNEEDPLPVKSNCFKIEFPPKSGKFIKCPEVVDGRFFTIDEAIKQIRTRQLVFLDRLASELSLETK